MPEKNWKFSAHDVHERGYWDDYQRAFSEMLSATSTAWAPWHVIPADHKWFARAAAAAVIIEALKDIDPRYPRLDPAALSALTQAKAELEAEAGGPAAASASADEAEAARHTLAASQAGPPRPLAPYRPPPGGPAAPDRPRLPASVPGRALVERYAARRSRARSVSVPETSCSRAASATLPPYTARP